MRAYILDVVSIFSSLHSLTHSSLGWSWLQSQDARLYLLTYNAHIHTSFASSPSPSSMRPAVGLDPYARTWTAEAEEMPHHSFDATPTTRWSSVSAPHPVVEVLHASPRMVADLRNTIHHLQLEVDRLRRTQRNHDVGADGRQQCAQLQEQLDLSRSETQALTRALLLEQERNHHLQQRLLVLENRGGWASRPDEELRVVPLRRSTTQPPSSATGAEVGGATPVRRVEVNGSPLRSPPAHRFVDSRCWSTSRMMRGTTTPQEESQPPGMMNEMHHHAHTHTHTRGLRQAPDDLPLRDTTTSSTSPPVASAPAALHQSWMTAGEQSSQDSSTMMMRGAEASSMVDLVRRSQQLRRAIEKQRCRIGRPQHN